MIALERRCVVVDRQCRESEGKAKIEGYMSVSDEEAHQRSHEGVLTGPCYPITVLNINVWTSLVVTSITHLKYILAN